MHGQHAISTWRVTVPKVSRQDGTLPPSRPRLHPTLSLTNLPPEKGHDQHDRPLRPTKSLTKRPQQNTSFHAIRVPSRLVAPQRKDRFSLLEHFTDERR